MGNLFTRKFGSLWKIHILMDTRCRALVLAMARRSRERDLLGQRPIRYCTVGIMMTCAVDIAIFTQAERSWFAIQCDRARDRPTCWSAGDRCIRTMIDCLLLHNRVFDLIHNRSCFSISNGNVFSQWVLVLIDKLIVRLWHLSRDTWHMTLCISIQLCEFALKIE